MIAAAEETEAVAAALGIEIPFDVSEQVIMVAQATASNYSSMLQDMRRGELTEIESINCAIVRAAALHGVPAPVNYMLCKLVRAARSQ